MQELEIKNVDCHATLGMIEKRWGFPRRTLRALLGMTCPQSGRSMIEMLGVLAIIGVLSVGGIAGYSKAMQKYRINKAIEQITLIVGNVRSFFAPQNSYEGLSSYPVGQPIIKKAKLIPEEMWEDGKDQPQTIFGYNFYLEFTDKSKRGDNRAFEIGYRIGYNTDACIELATQDWTGANVSFIRLGNGGPVGEKYFKLPIPIDKATDACSNMVQKAQNINAGNLCSLAFYFDADMNSEAWKNISWQN